MTMSMSNENTKGQLQSLLRKDLTKYEGALNMSLELKHVAEEILKSEGEEVEERKKRKNKLSQEDMPLLEDRNHSKAGLTNFHLYTIGSFAWQDFKDIKRLRRRELMPNHVKLQDLKLIKLMLTIRRL
ncbi:hypothetical protein ACJX0J_025184, partial [Zea mays]